MTQHCPSCANKVVSPYGYGNILIIGDSPERGEQRPFTGAPYLDKRKSKGWVLRKELANLGVDLLQFRVAYLWLHEPNKDENCFKAGVDVCLEEAKGKNAILLVGSESVEYFTGHKVTDVNGLQVESPMLSCSIIYATVNPALAFHRGLGEVRFSIEQFVNRLKKETLI